MPLSFAPALKAHAYHSSPLSFSLSEPITKATEKDAFWSNYVRGVCKVLIDEKGLKLRGAKLVIGGDIPQVCQPQQPVMPATSTGRNISLLHPNKGFSCSMNFFAASKLPFTFELTNYVNYVGSKSAPPLSFRNMDVT